MERAHPHRRSTYALRELAAVALGVFTLSSANGAHAQEALPEPTAQLVLRLTNQESSDAEKLENVAPLPQAYDMGQEVSAMEAALRRAIHEAPPSAPWDHPRMIVFAGGGDEALIWSPANHDEAAQFSYRDDRVELGDIHAGVGWEANGVTVSLGYLENQYRSPFGSQSESSASLGLTWRR